MFGLASSLAPPGDGAAGAGAASPLSSWFLLDGPPDFRPAAARALANVAPPPAAAAARAGAALAAAGATQGSAAPGPAPRATLEAWCDWLAVEQRLKARDPALCAEMERVEAELRAAEAAASAASAAPSASAARPARDQGEGEGADLLGLSHVRRELRSELDAALVFEKVLLGSLR